MVEKRREAETSEDLVSRLPDEVLTHILAYLPTKSSVKTCVLSKRWSRLWISVPNIDIPWCYFDCSVRRAQFENFMDRFLNLSLSNVRSVRMIKYQLGRDSEVSRVNAWLAAFGDRDAEKIYLTLRLGDSCSLVYSLPDTFFIQNNLVKLELTTFTLKVPQLVCFPKLKEIVLRAVQPFDETSMKNLLFGSPVLSTLDMFLDRRDKVQTLHICSSSLRNLYLFIADNTSHDHDVAIDCPNLTFLSLTDYGSSTFNIINASLLASAYLYILDGEKLLKLLIQISHVEELEFYQCFMNDLPDTPLANLPMLHNLIHLTVETEMEDDDRTSSRLLYCTPNLVTFTLKKTSNGSLIGPLTDPFAWCEPHKVPQCLLSSIERVKLEGFGDRDKDIQMITNILKNARILNKLSIHCHPRFLVNETKFLTTLLTLPRSSTTCQVEYKLH